MAELCILHPFKEPARGNTVSVALSMRKNKLENT